MPCRPFQLSNGTYLLSESSSLCLLERVANEHGNSHWSDTSWHWSQVSGDFLRGLSIDVSVDLARSWILANVDSAVDDKCSWLDPIGFDEVLTANGDNEYVSTEAFFLEVWRFRVANCDSPVMPEKECGSRGSNNLRTSEHNDFFSRNKVLVPSGLLDKVEAPKRSAWEDCALKFSTSETSGIDTG